MKVRGGWEINWSVCKTFTEIIATKMSIVEESNAIFALSAEAQVRLGMCMLKMICC